MPAPLALGGRRITSSSWRRGNCCCRSDLEVAGSCGDPLVDIPARRRPDCRAAGVPVSRLSTRSDTADGRLWHGDVYAGGPRLEVHVLRQPYPRITDSRAQYFAFMFCKQAGPGAHHRPTHWARADAGFYRTRAYQARSLEVTLVGQSFVKCAPKLSNHNLFNGRLFRVSIFVICHYTRFRRFIAPVSRLV